LWRTTPRTAKSRAEAWHYIKKEKERKVKSVEEKELEGEF
jgi:hypothetical protein